MKTLKIGIASYDEMKARTMAIARGEIRPKPGGTEGVVHLNGELRQGVIQEEPGAARSDR